MKYDIDINEAKKFIKNPNWSLDLIKEWCGNLDKNSQIPLPEKKLLEIDGSFEENFKNFFGNEISVPQQELLFRLIDKNLVNTDVKQTFIHIHKLVIELKKFWSLMVFMNELDD